MKPSSKEFESNVEIVKNAPKDATHFIVHQYEFAEAYGRLSDGVMSFKDEYGRWVEASDFEFHGLIQVRSLDDIRLLAELEALYMESIKY